MTWRDDSQEAPADASRSGRELVAAIAALVAAERQLAEVIASVPEAAYVRKPVGVISGSIGGHVRHCLDHVAALLVAATTGVLDYDDRRRDTEIERSPHAALALVAQQEAELAQLAASVPREQLALRTLVAVDAPPIVVTTSLARELAFVTSHTIHHSALLAAMVKLLGRDVPAGFGYAIATLAQQEAAACVR